MGGEGIAPGAAPTVLLGDDHVAARAGARLVLEANGFAVVAEARSADAAVAAAFAHEPDLCLLADHMPGGAISAIQRIAAALPATKLALLTGSESAPELLSALFAGADGYLLKTGDPERLPVTLRALLDGQVVVPRALTGSLVADLRRRDKVRTIAVASDSVALTSRELEVLSLLHDGMTTQAMADRLRISPVTVRRHISKSVQKLGESDRRGALRLLADVGEPGNAGAEPGTRSMRPLHDDSIAQPA